MENKKAAVSLASYDHKNYNPGANIIARITWYFVNALIFNSSLFPFSRLKANLLRLFGAKVGRGVVIKPRIRIKYPWFLEIGSNVWIGEDVWIDNLSWVKIHNNVCISQEAFVLTGNHDYKDVRFGLIVQGVTIQEGAWIGARSTVCPGVEVKANAVLTVGSILAQDADENGIYQGNPARLVRTRVLRNKHA